MMEHTLMPNSLPVVEDNLVRKYINGVVEVLQALDTREVRAFVTVLRRARDEGRQIFIFGNGGSASTASHFAADLNKGASYGRTRRFKMICLNDNMATLTAYANDVSYNDIFVEPLRNLMNPGDVVIGISGSGNSENVLRAIRYANERDAVTVGLCGYREGKLASLVHVPVRANVNDMQQAEDVHLVIGHIVSRALCEDA
ncbi:SIS domain-containing protein [Polyangium sp. 6x1]|uniref:D-sedoheptulose-7-phosphate isomerase n=1 Tax=Polyangium sp. 6x1 TaxID=3042689 RepID=UPI0024823743|nr:SIS domain-containing protein [Polyangium sp. 6x1]MDI1443029.1 SIS domain-containing protein [Polyangium sp. 6x1]